MALTLFQMEKALHWERCLWAQPFSLLLSSAHEIDTIYLHPLKWANWHQSADTDHSISTPRAVALPPGSQGCPRILGFSDFVDSSIKGHNNNYLSEECDRYGSMKKIIKIIVHFTKITFLLFTKITFLLFTKITFLLFTKITFRSQIEILSNTTCNCLRYISFLPTLALVTWHPGHGAIKVLLLVVESGPAGALIHEGLEHLDQASHALWAPLQLSIGTVKDTRIEARVVSIAKFFVNILSRLEDKLRIKTNIGKISIRGQFFVVCSNVSTE